ncbi:GrdX family protein [Carboxydothermus pertinax]|nr:GrdX family protein [Carboxydothermus pertinax]
MIVITNNPKVKEYIQKYQLNKRFSLLWVDGFTEDVLEKVRDLCHFGHKLLTHPLTGSIKPNQTPYKTVVVDHLEQEIDFNSILIAENSYFKTLELLTKRPRPKETELFLDDFAVIDLDFFKSFLTSLGLII